MKKFITLCVLAVSSLAYSQVGINTVNPQRQLHVNGSLQVTNELNVGGDASTAGSAGVAGQILTSNGSNSAPSWQSVNVLKGAFAGEYYIQGTNALVVNQGQNLDVPGLTQTVTVPAGLTQTLFFTITGYASINQPGGPIAGGGQGVFALYQDGVKISSAYSSTADAGNLLNLPSSTVILKAVTLSPGTYTFTVRYSAWFADQIVNLDPSFYSGYDGDNEAMLTKMQIIVFNQN